VFLQEREFTSPATAYEVEAMSLPTRQQVASAFGIAVRWLRNDKGLSEEVAEGSESDPTYP
jgi:hypothetical protein